MGQGEHRLDDALLVELQVAAARLEARATHLREDDGAPARAGLARLRLRLRVRLSLRMTLTLILTPLTLTMTLTLTLTLTLTFLRGTPPVST